MFDRAKEIVSMVAERTDEIVLFHSLSGKDSIALLDLLSPKFKRVLCVYMYLIKDLRHIGQYCAWAKAKYPNAEFVQVPHYALYSYIKYGFMGMTANPQQRLWTLAQIAQVVKERSGIEWSAYGFKQSDSLNRRLMLRSYKDGKEAICWKTSKCYPLSTYKNREVLNYIHSNNLKEPETYGGGGQSCGCDVTSPDYLNYLRINYPDDLEKIYSIFPATRTILPDYEKQLNENNQEVAN